MQIHYSSDGEQAGFMTLATLLRNFSDNDVKFWKSDIVNELESRGWYEGNHACGRYLILNCAKFPLQHQSHKINEEV